MLYGRQPKPEHYAHIGQEVVVHYKWHPLYGRSVKRFYTDQRAAGPIVHIERLGGIASVIPEWMLDASVCSAMTLGAPRAAAAALLDLHRLLVESGLRRSCHDSVSNQRETRDASQGNPQQEATDAASAADGAGQCTTTNDEQRAAQTSDRPVGSNAPARARRKSNGAR